MNILLWYLPYAMFSGACDLALSKSETQADGWLPAETADGPTPESLDITNTSRVASLH
jgi:hypothetical protein